jgi:transposase
MSEKRRRYKKHPYSDRLQIVSKVLDEHYPIRTTGKLFDANQRQVKYWVALYSRYGEEGLRMQSRYYPMEFKYKVLQDMFETHLTLQETALKYGIPSPSTVLMWKRKYDKKGLLGLNDGSRIWTENMVKEDDATSSDKKKNQELPPGGRERKDLLKEIDFLKAENAYLKKLRALVQERIARENKNGLPPSKN